MRLRALPALAIAVWLLAMIPAARAAGCGRAVVVTLPGVTWEDVRQYRPPAILELAERGAVASMATRTIAPRNSYAGAFATLGAGSRMEAGPGAGAVAEEGGRGLLAPVRVAGIAEMRRLADRAGYGAQPGALGDVLENRIAAIGNADLGDPPPAPAGFGRWTALAAMDGSGRAARAAVAPELLSPDPSAPWGVRTNVNALQSALTEALEQPCSAVFVDHGDLVRSEQLAVAEARPPGPEWVDALEASDAMVEILLDELDLERDLLVVVTPTSPAWSEQTHLGVALAAGPAFPAGTVLESASTRRRGVVTLPDVAPTLLTHLEERPAASMTGRPFVSAEPGTADREQAAVDLDRESVFVGGLQSGVSTGFVVVQVLVYLCIGYLLFRRERDPRAFVGSPLWHYLELAALAVIAFPICTYLMGALDAHRLGAAPYVAVMVVLAIALVGIAARLFDDSLDRLLALTAITTAVLYADLVLGGRLQLNTVFGYSPIIAGRFAGAGNIVFAVLGAATLLTGVLIIHRWPASRYAYAGVAALFIATVVVDGAPQLGSDVGGVIALVPSFALTFFLLLGRRPSWKVAGIAVAGVALALGLFLALDLARPAEAQTHLARLYEDVSERGLGALGDTLERKARANMRVFRSSVWTFFVPPALALLAWLLRRPRGRWQRFADRFPRLRAGLLGGLVLAVLGFAVNDSGIVIPAVILSFLVPLALITHLCLEREFAE